MVEEATSRKREGCCDRRRKEKKKTKRRCGMRNLCQMSKPHHRHRTRYEMKWKNIHRSGCVNKCDGRKMTIRNNAEKVTVLSDHGYEIS